MIIMDGKEYLDLNETAKKLKVSTTTVRIRTRAKEMPLPQKLKSLTFWLKSDIDEYLKNQEKP